MYFVFVVTTVVQEQYTSILEKRLSATSGVPRTAKKRPDDPRQCGLVSGVPAPSTEALLQTQVSRGLGELDDNI